MSFIRVKVCGITRIDDALACAEAGVDAIGLVFVPASKRYVGLAEASAICRALPPFVHRVGLFMDASAEMVRATIEAVPIDWLQFHGQESPSYCRQFHRPWIKALSMGAGSQSPEAYPEADAILLDSHAPGGLGGSGHTFDWSQVPAISRPWVLAGGLTPANVGDAIRQLKPHAVDVSSGVEAAPGIKSSLLISQFMKAIRYGKASKQA